VNKYYINYSYFHTNYNAFITLFLNGSMTAVESSGKITNTWGNIRQ